MKKVIVCAMLALSFNASAFSLSETLQKGAVVSESINILTQKETQAERIDREMKAAQEEQARKDQGGKIDLFGPTDGKADSGMSTQEKKHVNLWD